MVSAAVCSVGWNITEEVAAPRMLAVWVWVCSHAGIYTCGWVGVVFRLGAVMPGIGRPLLCTKIPGIRMIAEYRCEEVLAAPPGLLLLLLLSTAFWLEASGPHGTEVYGPVAWCDVVVDWLAITLLGACMPPGISGFGGVIWYCGAFTFK